MKRLSRLFPFLALLTSFILLSGCSRSSPDAGVLLREAKSEAESTPSCTADITQELVFTANAAQHVFSSSNDIIYQGKPFALKSVQKIQRDGTPADSETYTMTEGGKLFFYCKPNGVWQKTDAGNLDTSPAAQVDIFRLLNDAEDQKYVRQTTVGSQEVQKVELKLNPEILHSTLENIATSTGMANGSHTVVQTLLDSAPDLYGYCYIRVDNGRMVRLEADLTDAVNQIFQKIDGGSVTVHVVKCKISGDVSSVGSAPSIRLPEAAKRASAVQAYG